MSSGLGNSKATLEDPQGRDRPGASLDSGVGGRASMRTEQTEQGGYHTRVRGGSNLTDHG